MRGNKRRVNCVKDIFLSIKLKKINTASWLQILQSFCYRLKALKGDKLQSRRVRMAFSNTHTFVCHSPCWVPLFAWSAVGYWRSFRSKRNLWGGKETTVSVHTPTVCQLQAASPVTLPHLLRLTGLFQRLNRAFSAGLHDRSAAAFWRVPQHRHLKTNALTLWKAMAFVTQPHK